MINRSTVFIPIVSPSPKSYSRDTDSSSNSVETKLIEVYSEPIRTGEDSHNSLLITDKIRRVWSTVESKAMDKCWDPVAAPLRVSNPVLYKAGCTAVNAVRKLRLKRPAFGFFQLFKPQAAIGVQRLHSVSVWGPTEGNSAELGLAIALATSICNVGNGVIVATGALSSTSTDASVPLIRTGDVKVYAVGQVREKLAALVSNITQGAFEDVSGKKPLLVFTPKNYKQGDDEYEVSQLAEVQQLRKLGVKVITVDWLSEVFNALQVNRTRYLFQDRLLLIITGIVFLCVATFYSWITWRDAHIPMQYTQVGLSGISPEPFELCKLGDRQYALPIEKVSSIPSIPITSTIAWKTMIGNASSIDATLAEKFGYEGYYIIVIVVSEFSPVTFDTVRNDNSNEPIRILPGNSYDGWIKLNDTAEINILMILAQRQEVDIEQLRLKYKERFFQNKNNLPNNKRLNVDAVSDFFTRLAPGTLLYPFLTVKEKSKCIS